MSLVGLKLRQPILNMYKIIFHCYTIYETINLFAIGFMVNPSHNCNKVFRIKVWQCLSLSFSDRTMKIIKDCLRENKTCVMDLIMIYENNGEIPKTMYIVLSFVVYSLI